MSLYTTLGDQHGREWVLFGKHHMSKITLIIVILILIEISINWIDKTRGFEIANPIF